jgi:NADH:ubiquinone oxidoreductase subunit B-like Fe-S oxidoreductase
MKEEEKEDPNIVKEVIDGREVYKISVDLPHDAYVALKHAAYKYMVPVDVLMRFCVMQTTQDFLTNFYKLQEDMARADKIKEKEEEKKEKEEKGK